MVTNKPLDLFLMKIVICDSTIYTNFKGTQIFFILSEMNLLFQSILDELASISFLH